MTTDFRALCAELVETWDATADFNFNDFGHAAADIVDRARAALATPPPEAPADGEVVELVVDELTRHLLTKAATEKANRCPYSATLLTRAADILQRQYPQPVPVSERLPEPSVKVLAHYFNALGKDRTICAIWVPAKSRSDKGDLDADDFLEYDDESDKYHWPEGWYEAIENWEELGWAKVYEGEIAYWQPLPQWPANALPTPEATNA